jgi:hypothetical protein
MSDTLDLRFRNPFREATSSELIDNPQVYARIFSQEILVNETLDVFEKNNIVLTGPQGTGKTMILCLFQHSFLSACLKRQDTARILKNVQPYVSISINLVRSGFHVFGRRSPGDAFPGRVEGTREDLNAQCASDVLCHTLFRQLLNYCEFLLSDEGLALRTWMGITANGLIESQLARDMARWKCWRGYYSKRGSLKSLRARCEERLGAWHDFLNVNTDRVPDDVWRTTPPMEEALHNMGVVASSFSASSRRAIPLYVVIDQYEVLPELNRVYGTSLQRIVNSLIKARDPYVFYKIGARPYDWGREVRVWGSESRLEVDRDYKIVSLTDVLRKGENKRGWLFPKFATDVAARRLRDLCEGLECTADYVKKMFGRWSESQESALYTGGKRARRDVVLKGVPQSLQTSIERICGRDASLLELRLAAAWVTQQIQREFDLDAIRQMMRDNEPPWRRSSWRKERIEVALLQIASMTNQRKIYFGWKTVLYLSGADIRAFLRICEEVWELAAKVSPERLKGNQYVPWELQTEGIMEASHHWRVRDRTETQGGGSRRYAVLGKLGPAINEYLVKDSAISNPGYSGFSVREADLNAARATEVAEFLRNGVNWAIFEERPHTSKNREAATRSKWFLHPILSPAFGIPVRRVKEPFYTTVDAINEWLSVDGAVRFGPRGRARGADPRKRSTPKQNRQRQLDFGDDG